MSEPLFEPRSIQLKDGARATIRPVEFADAAGLLELQCSVHLDGRGIMKQDDEAPKDAKEMRRHLEQWLEGDYTGAEGIFLVVESDGRIAGEAGARRHRMRRLHHTARFGLAVHTDFQGRGVGRALVRGIIDWAGATRRAATPRDPGVLRLELSVLGDNERAIGLYTSLGFRIEGRCPGKVRESDGALRTDLDMALWVGDADVSPGDPD